MVEPPLTFVRFKDFFLFGLPFGLISMVLIFRAKCGRTARLISGLSEVYITDINVLF